MASEATMQLWDHWRRRIAEGCTNSSPRDWFENEIDDRDQRIAELEAENNKLKAKQLVMSRHVDNVVWSFEHGTVTNEETERAWRNVLAILLS